MQDTILSIQTQYYENYGDSVNPRWKPKGGQLFEIMVDSDDMYDQDVAKEAIIEILKGQNSSHEKFEFLSYELIFSNPIKLSSSEFENLIIEKGRAKYESQSDN
jgi:hypothetical protein